MIVMLLDYPGDIGYTVVPTPVLDVLARQHGREADLDAA